MSSNQTFAYDVAVLGGGSAGYAAARATAQAGLRTVVIEGGKEVGGLCILRGCMPTKALLYAADVLDLTRRANAWGIYPQEVSFDFKRVMGRKDILIKEFARDREQQLGSGHFAFIRAEARFRNANTIDLTGGGTLTARHFIISTGSIVSPPPLVQLGEAGYWTSDEALSISELPASLIILGGGPVAVEFAQFFLRFGVKVTLIQRSEHVLRDFDTDIALALESVFSRESMILYHNTKLTGAWRNERVKGISFLCDGKKIQVEAEQMLFGLGRVPNTATLNLEKAGIATEHGRILTNAQMQTSAPHIYAAGDCTGPYDIVHVAIQQGEVAAQNIARPEEPRSIDYRLLTHVVFTDPQVASVGLTEKEAQARKIPYLKANYPFADHGKSLIMEARDGFVKLLANPSTGEIIGGSVVGPIGGELIHEVITAMSNHMTVHALAAMPHYHPTLSEIWTYPAEELAAKITLSIQ